jgi:thiamine biosynthesis lipoprotein
MGTFYNITYESSLNLKSEIDEILIDINNGVSTYISNSTISILNTDSLGIIANKQVIYSLPVNKHFINNYNSAKEVYNISNNFFDPTIMPLVNYWGFGYSGKRPIEEVDSLKVHQLKSTVGFDKWSMQEVNSELHIRKPISSKLDFSGIAKGYGVDYIAAFLDAKNIKNYMVEIGGEVMTMGHNSKSLLWTIGLSKPEVKAGYRDFQTLVSLSGVGMASSGNYRNYYEVDGKTYGHEINPKTGYPEINQLLGTSVIANNCKMADAYATAFMVMGLEKSQNLIENLDGLEACFFIRSQSGEISTVTSSDFQRYLKK